MSACLNNPTQIPLLPSATATAMHGVATATSGPMCRLDAPARRVPEEIFYLNLSPVYVFHPKKYIFLSLISIFLSRKYIFQGKKYIFPARK